MEVAQKRQGLSPHHLELENIFGPNVKNNHNSTSRDSNKNRLLESGNGFLVEHLTDWGEEKLVSRCASTINDPILDQLKSFFLAKKSF